MKALRDQLGGGDRQSKGTADAIAAEALDDPPLVAALVAALDDPDELVRLRAADALEKASAARPEIIAPHASTLLGRPADLAQHDVRWHIAQMIPRLPLDEPQLARAVAVLRTTLVSESRVARTMALDALVRLADREWSLRPAARRAISAVRSRGSPAEQARARILSKRRGWIDASRTPAARRER